MFPRFPRGSRASLRAPALCFARRDRRADGLLPPGTPSVFENLTERLGKGKEEHAAPGGEGGVAAPAVEDLRAGGH